MLKRSEIQAYGNGRRYEGFGGDERGAALVTALVFLVLLTILGLASVMTSSTEILMSRNDRLSKLATDYANAGVQMTLAALDAKAVGYEYLAYDLRVNAGLSVHKDYGLNTGWNVNSSDYAVLNDINFTTNAKYLSENADHHFGPLDGDVVGYCKELDYNKSPIANYRSAFPVYKIESTGKVMRGSDVLASSVVKVEVTKNVLNIFSDYGGYAGGCVTIAGSGNQYSDNGEDGITAIATGGTGCPDAADVTAAATSTGSDYNDGVSVDLDTYLGFSKSELIGFATSRTLYSSKETVPPGTHFGDVGTNTSEVVYYGYTGPVLDESLADKVDNNVVMNNCVGYGVLIVDGDLQITGTFSWTGMVYVFGDVTLGGGGSEAKNITGAILCSGDMTVGGNLYQTYNSDALADMGNDTFQTKIVNWRREYNY